MNLDAGFLLLKMKVAEIVTLSSRRKILKKE